MFTRKTWAILFCILVFAVLVLPVACSAPPATPQVVVQTQVVKQTVPVEITKVVQQTVPVEITKVVQQTVSVQVTKVVDPRFGGVLKAAIAAAPPTLDAMATSAAATTEVTMSVLEGLVAYDENFKVAPVLAEKWDVSPDGKTYTFTLRQGVKFHNGKEMSSDDVIASIKRFLDVTTRKTQFALLQSYVAKDKYTVVFTLSSPSLAFIEALAHPASAAVIMPKEVIEGKKDLKPEDIIGTGPYKVAEFKADQLIRLTRFADYKPLTGERSGLAGAKVAFFDEIQYIPVPEAGARVAGLETGAYDWIESVPVSQYTRLSGVAGVKVYQQLPLEWNVFLFFNHANKFSSDLKFRQAVAAAVDLDAVGMAATNGLPQFYRLNQSLWVPQSQWHVENAVSAQVYNEKNLDKAKQLLKESGYNGEEIVLATTRDYDWAYRPALSVADQLKKNLGMNVKVDVMDWVANQARWKEKTTWQLSLSGFRSQAIFAPDGYAAGFTTGSGDLTAFYSNADMDKAFTDARVATTTEQRKAAFTQVQDTFYKTLPYMQLINTLGAEGIRTNIQGHQPWWWGARFWGTWKGN